MPSWSSSPASRDKAVADFVPPAERIAVFDNDGTLWSEQPVPVQLAFALDRVKALAPQHPEWKDKQPFKAVLEGDMKALAESGERGLLELFMATHAGMTTDEFSKIVTDWLATARHPRVQSALHRARLPADARSARLSPRQWLQDLHRVGRRHRVHAPVGRTGLRHSARAGHRLVDQDQVRDARRQTRRCSGCRSSTSTTTRRASRSPSTSTSAAARSPHSATPMATSKCCNGRR